MDSRKTMHYVEVDDKEKRAVFGLGVVKRAMRSLPYNNIMMSKYSLTTAKQYMQIGPGRASILSIGYEALQEEAQIQHREEKRIVSGMIRLILDLSGHNVPSLMLSTAACLSEIGFLAMHMHKHGATLVSGSCMVSTSVYGIIHSLSCWQEVKTNAR